MAGVVLASAAAAITDPRLDDLVRLRRVRDRIDRDYAQPLDVRALAYDAGWSAGHLSRHFTTVYGMSPYAYVVSRRALRAVAA
jgi:AraC-like DNA-binding protein